MHATALNPVKGLAPYALQVTKVKYTKIWGDGEREVQPAEEGVPETLRRGVERWNT